MATHAPSHREGLAHLLDDFDFLDVAVAVRTLYSSGYMSHVGELDMVRLYYRLGVRTLGITHGEGGAAEEGFLQGSKSPFGPCTMAEREEERKNAAGLTRFGCEVLKLSNELGLVTDLAHINDRAFYEVLEQSAKPWGNCNVV